MGKNKNKHSKGYQWKPDDILSNEVAKGNRYFMHYYNYLRSIAFQMFEWEGLPDSIDPVFLEQTLHNRGRVAFYHDKELGYLVLDGAYSGTFNVYQRPTSFHAHSINYQKTFPLYYYSDIKKPDKQGVIIYNNDMEHPTYHSLYLFASDLAELKETININQRAQKTPALVYGSDYNRLTMKNVFLEVDGNSPVIYLDKNFNPDDLKSLNLEAPYRGDKLMSLRSEIWNEVMTFLGIKNSNTDKKERLVTSEVESNNEQIKSSGNIFLKTREEACKRINDLYGLNVSVRFRHEIFEVNEEGELTINESNNGNKKIDTNSNEKRNWFSKKK